MSKNAKEIIRENALKRVENLDREVTLTDIIPIINGSTYTTATLFRLLFSLNNKKGYKMKFQMYNILKKDKVVKQLLTWNEVRDFAHQIIQEKIKTIKDHNLQFEYKCIINSNEYEIINFLKSEKYDVVARTIKLDLIPSLSATNNYYKFNDIPKKLLNSHNQEEHNKRNNFYKNRTGSRKKLRNNVTIKDDNIKDISLLY